MNIEKIKPIPKYIIEMIKRRDKKLIPVASGQTRYYAYLTKNNKELVKVTVAVKHKYGKWYCKQVAVHGVHSDVCFVKDMTYTYLCGYITGWYSEGLTKHSKWYESEGFCEADDKYFDPFALIVNKEYIAKFPEYKYSAYELYNGEDILQYLRLYEKYPQTEYLLKLGLANYVKSKQLLHKIEKDKKFRKWLAINRNELKSNYYYILTILQAYKENEPIQEIQLYESAKKQLCKENCLKPIRDMLNGDYKKYIAYTQKQQITNRLYLDYLNACNYLGLDMNEEKNRYPHDFKYWHDIRIDEYSTAKALKDEQERKEMYEKFSLVAEKYLPLQEKKKGQYLVIIAKSPAELIQEGTKLNHCVGRMNYDQKFIREETLIFFIRSIENPIEPLVTMEYSIKEKKVLQCYAKGNTQPTKDVMDYLNEIWLPYANKKMKKIVA